MKILIHRNKLQCVLYIKLTCTWFKIIILICCVSCYCAILVFNKLNTANSLPLYIIKTDACVKCNYTVCECLLLPRDAAMLAWSWKS